MWLRCPNHKHRARNNPQCVLNAEYLIRLSLGQVKWSGWTRGRGFNECVINFVQRALLKRVRRSVSLSTHTQSSHAAIADESCSDGDKKMPACCWGEAPGRLHGRVNVLISTISTCVSNHPSLSNHANYSYYLNTHTDTHTLQCKCLWDSSLNGGNKIKRVTCVYAQVCLLMKVGAD